MTQPTIETNSTYTETTTPDVVGESHNTEDIDLDAVPRLSEPAAPAWSRPAMQYRAVPHGQYLDRPASHAMAAVQVVEAAWAKVEQVGEAVQAAVDSLRALDGERQRIVRDAERSAFADAKAGKVPKPVRATLDVDAERAAREGRHRGALEALRRQRAQYDVVWSREAPGAAQALVESVPAALAEARKAFATAESQCVLHWLR